MTVQSRLDHQRELDPACTDQYSFNGAQVRHFT